MWRKNKFGINVDHSVSGKAPEKRKKYSADHVSDASSTESSDEESLNLKKIAEKLPQFSDEKKM